MLHIGVPKTGTTTVQTALAALPGVHHGSPTAECPITMPGSPIEQARAALAILQSDVGWPHEGATVDPRHWPRMVRRVRTTPGTVFFSSEYLCEADRPTIRRIADDLGADGVHVVITLRPLSKILPSAWQQYLKSGHQFPYERWLKAILATPPKRSVTPSFWRRHDHGAVVERWADEVGPSRLSVIVPCDDDRQLLLRSFAELLGLAPGSGPATPTGAGNRSMTAAEAELFRQVNIVLRGAGLPWPDYAHLLRYGAILRTVERITPSPDATRIVTPAWAADRVGELGSDYVQRIGALQAQGLQVIGDLDLLAKPSIPVPSGFKALQAPSHERAQPSMIPVEVAVQAVLGTVLKAATGTAFLEHECDCPAGAEAAGMRGERPTEGAAGKPGGKQVYPGYLPVNRLTFHQLLGLLATRVQRGLVRRWHSLTHS